MYSQVRRAVLRAFLPFWLLATAAQSDGCNLTASKVAQHCFSDVVVCGQPDDGAYTYWPVSDGAYIESALDCFPNSDSDPLRCINALCDAVVDETGATVELGAACVPDRTSHQQLEITICDPDGAPVP